MSVFAFTSGKGGVGKSTLAAGFALALAQQQSRVLLIDGDLALANLDVLLGVRAHGSLYDVVKGSRRLGEIIHPVTTGLDLVPGGSGLSLLMQSGPKRLAVIYRQLEDLADSYDHMVIDTSAGIDPRVRSLCAMADLTAIVVVPEATSMVDAYACAKLLHQADPTLPTGWLVNQSDSEDQAAGVAERMGSVTEAFLSTRPPLLGSVPRVPGHGAARPPLVAAYPHGFAATALHVLARELPKVAHHGRFSAGVARLAAA